MGLIWLGKDSTFLQCRNSYARRPAYFRLQSDLFACICIVHWIAVQWSAVRHSQSSLRSRRCCAVRKAWTYAGYSLCHERRTCFVHDCEIAHALLSYALACGFHTKLCTSCSLYAYAHSSYIQLLTRRLVPNSIAWDSSMNLLCVSNDRDRSRLCKLYTYWFFSSC